MEAARQSVDGRKRSIFKPIDLQAAMDGLALLPAQRNKIRMLSKMPPVQPLFCRRRDQPRRQPLANIKPGSQHQHWGREAGWIDDDRQAVDEKRTICAGEKIEL